MAELVGWKAIAAHLGVSVRTAQRYERTLSLPVTRVTHAGRGEEVQALSEAIDTWLARTAMRREAEGGDGGETVRPAGEPLEALSIKR